MQEITTNIHIHTRYSDGGGSYTDVARAALAARLDAVIITDHNVLVGGMEGYFKDGKRKVLVLTGEEVHDRARLPQKSHMLVLGARHGLAPLAEDVDQLARAVAAAGGLSFLAHLSDPASPPFREPDISWVDWTVQAYTGIELWNGLSELKAHLRTKLHGIFYAFFPALVAHAPLTTTLQRWDQLLSARQVVAIGGSDAHALRHWMGIISRVIYPYAFHFSGINTHVLVSESLTGNIASDKREIYGALASGHCFVGYDKPASTLGFRFAAHGAGSEAIMGDEIPVRGSVTLHAHLPYFAEVRLLKDGRVIHSVGKTQDVTYVASLRGVYRIEAYRRYLGRRRGWIFSNPIYLR